MAYSTTCRECGTVFEAKREGAGFCSRPCRNAFHNRRRDRGASFYDYFMAIRYDRDKASDAGLWSALCRMAEEFNDEDLIQRGERRSWDSPYKHLEQNPVLKAERLQGMTRKDKRERQERKEAHDQQ